MSWFRRRSESTPVAVPATVVGTVVGIEPSAPPAAVEPSAPPLSVAEEFCECAICFDELYKGESGVFVGADGRRVCQHVFHRECASALASKNCPLCRRGFSRVRALPRLLAATDAAALRQWFAAVDTNGDGRLSKAEVLDALFSEVEADSRRLRRDVDALWSRWDADGNGFLDEREVARLFEFVSREYCPRARAPPPSLDASAASRAAFFDHWDEDRNGTLDKEEVTRALLKTFGLAARGAAAVAEMRETIDNVWCIFDPNGDGVIERAEWSMRDGLCDAVLAARQYAS